MLGSLTQGDWLRFAAGLKWPLEELEFLPPPVDFCLFLTSVSALSSDLIKLSSFKTLFPFQHFSDNKNSSFHFCVSTCEAQKPIFYANAKKMRIFASFHGWRQRYKSSLCTCARRHVKLTFFLWPAGGNITTVSRFEVNPHLPHSVISLNTCILKVMIKPNK